MTISEIWKNAWLALTNKREGFSVTKSISVLFATFCVVIASIYTDKSNLSIIIGLFFSAIFTLLVKKSVENNRSQKIKSEENKIDK